MTGSPPAAYTASTSLRAVTSAANRSAAAEAEKRAGIAMIGAGHSATHVVLSSVYFSRACTDLSRPLPLCFTPPKGTVISPSS